MQDTIEAARSYGAFVAVGFVSKSLKILPSCPLSEESFSTSPWEDVKICYLAGSIPSSQVISQLGRLLCSFITAVLSKTVFLTFK